MYLFCAAAEDEDVQKKGIVCVVMTLGPRCRGLLLDVPSAFKIPPLLGVFPVRVDAVHLGSDRSSIPANFAKIFPFVWSAMGVRMRVRSRYYIGMYNIILDSRLLSGTRSYCWILACHDE